MKKMKGCEKMSQYEAFIDAYLKGDSLFRFVYVPKRKELFLEDELEEADNGKFLYVPFKDSRELYLKMADFCYAQPPEIEATLYGALSSPSPIGKFHKVVGEIGLADVWEQEKRAFAQTKIQEWMEQHHIEL